MNRTPRPLSLALTLAAFALPGVAFAEEDAAFEPGLSSADKAAPMELAPAPDEAAAKHRGEHKHRGKHARGGPKKGKGKGKGKGKAKAGPAKAPKAGPAKAGERPRAHGPKVTPRHPHPRAGQPKGQVQRPGRGPAADRPDRPFAEKPGRGPAADRPDRPFAEKPGRGPAAEPPRGPRADGPRGPRADAPRDGVPRDGTRNGPRAGHRPPPRAQQAPVSQAVHRQAPRPTVDRAGKFAIGVTGGLLAQPSDGVPGGDLGLGVVARLRTVEALGFELSWANYQSDYESGMSAARTNPIQASAQLFVAPDSMLTPYVTAGYSWIKTDTGGADGADGARISGPHGGIGLEFAMGERAALGIDARYIHLPEAMPLSATVPGILQAQTGLHFYF